MIEGWKCPACGGAHAPDVKTCPIFAPLPPQHQQQDICDACRNGGICGCYRPNRYVISYC